MVPGVGSASELVPALAFRNDVRGECCAILTSSFPALSRQIGLELKGDSANTYVRWLCTNEAVSQNH